MKCKKVPITVIKPKTGDRRNGVFNRIFWGAFFKKIKSYQIGDIFERSEVNQSSNMGLNLF